MYIYIDRYANPILKEATIIYTHNIYIYNIYTCTYIIYIHYIYILCIDVGDKSTECLEVYG